MIVGLIGLGWLPMFWDDDDDDDNDDDADGYDSGYHHNQCYHQSFV